MNAPSFVKWEPNHPALVTLLTAFLQECSPIYLVGGYVRDIIAGWTTGVTDLDIALDQPAMPTARRIADRLGWAFFALDEGRDTARLVFKPDQKVEFVCDVASIRGDTIEADLYNRDFTINALAVALFRDGSSRLIDVSGGVEDITARRLRRVTAYALAEDALRLLRAVRLVAQFDLSLDLETRNQIERMSATIRTVSPERIRDEIWKTVTTARADFAIGMLSELGLLSHIFPEVAATKYVKQSAPHFQDVFKHSLTTMKFAAVLKSWIQEGLVPSLPFVEAMDVIEQELGPWRLKIRQQLDGDLAMGRNRSNWLTLVALLHDIGKPATQTAESVQQRSNGSSAKTSIRYRFIDHPVVGAQLVQGRLTYLRFSRLEINYAVTVVRNHMRPHLLHASFPQGAISRRACYRFFRDSAYNRNQIQVGLDILLLALCDYLAIHRQSPPPDWRHYVQHIAQLTGYLFELGPLAPKEMPPLVDGHLLLQYFDRPAGPWIGSVLDKLREAQMAGEIATTEEALKMVSNWLPAEDRDS